MFRLLLLFCFLIFVNAGPENAEFGTLLIVGKIKFNNDDAILFVYDDAVLVPNTNVLGEFNAKMDDLIGLARKNYTLKNTHKKMNNATGNFFSESKCVDMSENGLSPSRGVVCVGGSLPIRKFLQNNLPKKLTNQLEKAKEAREKLNEALKQDDSSKARGIVLHGQFLSTKRLINVIDVDTRKFWRFTRVGGTYEIPRSGSYGLVAKEGNVLKWTEKVFGHSSSLTEKNWTEYGLRRELKKLRENLPEYDNILGHFEALILRDVPPKDKNGLVHIKAEGRQ